MYSLRLKVSYEIHSSAATSTGLLLSSITQLNLQAVFKHFLHAFYSTSKIEYSKQYRYMLGHMSIGL